MKRASSRERFKKELGNILFSLANLSTHNGIDSEEALKSTNKSFEIRVKKYEKNKKVKCSPLERMPETKEKGII